MKDKLLTGMRLFWVTWNAVVTEYDAQKITGYHFSKVRENNYLISAMKVSDYRYK